MKKLIAVLSIALLASFTVQAQMSSEQKEIKTLTADYVDQVIESDWDGVMDRIYPGIFDLVDRETLIMTFEDMLGGASGMKMDFTEFEISEIGKVNQFKGGKFSLVDYDMAFTMTFMGDMADDDIINEVVNALRAEDSEVSRIAGKSAIEVKGPRTMLAINDSVSDGWKFIERRADDKALLEMMLPADLFKKLF